MYKLVPKEVEQAHFRVLIKADRNNGDYLMTE